MRTTCPGERVLESISVQNKSSRRQCFEVMPPKDIFTWLKISPTIFDLEPNEAARIEVQFLPPRDCGSRDPSEWYKSTSESQKSPSSLEGEGGEEAAGGEVQLVAQDGQEQVVLPEAALLVDRWGHPSTAA